jgi:superfamily I DNA/RNA helicase
MPAQVDVKAELKAATDRVLASKNPKKLVVAGPGAGKTYLFNELLKTSTGTPNQHLVLTFINTLKGDLDRNLGDSSRVFTLHGYCQSLLRRSPKLRNGLSENFRCYPGLRHLIPLDWKYLRGTAPPPFISRMRNLECEEDEKQFYFERCNYYDAIDFDDSVFRAHSQMSADASLVPAYSLILVDEFQDFNAMEASVIDLLADRSAIVIAGDDDQALYSALRSASWDHIRAHYEDGHYEIFELPFCMRCPEVIVGAVNDIIKKAQDGKKLNGRIQKPYRYYEPLKGEDSAKFPRIDIVETSVQRLNANYFGRYIEECIRAIPEEDVDTAASKNEPVALIIGSSPYRGQVEQHLKNVGLITVPQKDEPSVRLKALQILNEDQNSNLGWRIILSIGNQGTARDRIRKAAKEKRPLAEVISDEQRATVIAEAKVWAAQHPSVDLETEEEEPTQGTAVTSYEGSKGRSAQYVFLIGAHSGELPSNADDIKDIEICRFLVGLTRTKKKCTILYAKNAMGKFKQPSEFLNWIDKGRFDKKFISAEYWK